MRKKECVKNPTIDIDHTVGKRVDCVVSFFSSTTIFENDSYRKMSVKRPHSHIVNTFLPWQKIRFNNYNIYTAIVSYVV
jgi:hypothetical protein